MIFEGAPAIMLPTCSNEEPVVVLHASGDSGFFLPITVLLDTGSDTSLLTHATARALGLPMNPSGRLKSVKTVGSDSISYRPTTIHFALGLGGPWPVCISVEGGVAAPLTLRRDLIGLDFLRKFQFTWSLNTVTLVPGLEGW